MQDRAGDGSQRRVGLGQGDTGLKPRTYGQPPCVHTVIDMVPGRIDDGIGSKRSEDLRLLRWVGSNKSLRHHANHREWHVGDDQLTANHIGSAIEPRLPKAFTDYHREASRTATPAIVFRRKVPSHEGRDRSARKNCPLTRTP